MPQPHDVGSILGGRYKVTGLVTTSAERDLVLDGVDQVLDRSVSILVAGPDNAEQVAASAREIATGDRPGDVQVLDLGRADGSTYLVTNHAAAADLLDLVVAANPPYVEPFYTDTLGTEIFGQERPTEPEYYDDRYQQVRYDDEPEQEPHPPTRPAGIAPPPPSVPPHAGGGNSAAEGAPRKAEKAEQAEKPRVTLWSEDDYSSAPQAHEEDRREGTGRTGAMAAGAGAAAGGTARAASRFPASARSGADAFDDYEDTNDDHNKPRFTRWLAGSILALLIVAAAILAVTQLGSQFTPPAAVSSSSDSAQNGDEGDEEPAQSDSASPQDSEPAAESPAPSAEPVEPIADSIIRLVPDDPGLDAVNDGDLPLIIDGNPVTAWNSLVYANNTFGGYASNFALVVGLEEPSAITQIRLEQLNGSGGNFEVLLNDRPSLEGANQVGQGSFTSPSITIPVPEQDGAARTAEYVIINFTQLPRLSNSEGPYPWGIKLAEVEIS